MGFQTAKIYYFSGTGNSLNIAHNIGRSYGDYELIPIAKIINDKDINISGGIVGFVFPVYYSRPPVIVKEFIEKASFGKTSYIFAVASGAGIFGKVMSIFSVYLKKKKIKLNAGFIIGMPGNHPKYSRLIKKEPSEYYQACREKCDKIAQIIYDKRKTKIETNYGITGFYYSYFANSSLYKQSLAKQFDKSLYSNYDCINCEVCENVCPVGNITESVFFPKWNHNCISCLACYHFCEQKAIQLKGEEASEERYLNPYVDLVELAGLKK